MHKNLIVLGAILIILFSAITHVTHAATLSFDAQETSIGTEKDFNLGLDITAEKAINTISVAIQFPSTITPISIDNGNSVINLWVDAPHFDTTTRVLTFSGIIPGGFSGKSARMLTLKLHATGTGTSSIEFIPEETMVYLHTPDATKDTVKLSTLTLSVVPGKENIPVSIPDQEPPEAFIPQISQDKHTFEGKWFLTFNTQDKGTGVAKYQVAESRYDKDESKLEWHDAQSPYVLTDQALKSFVYVRAIDNAGNIRTEKMLPRYQLMWYENIYIWEMIIGILIVIITLYIANQKKPLTGLPA